MTVDEVEILLRAAEAGYFYEAMRFATTTLSMHSEAVAPFAANLLGRAVDVEEIRSLRGAVVAALWDDYDRRRPR